MSPFGQRTADGRWAGAVFAAVAGYLSLMLLIKVPKGSKFWLFGPYCFIVGLQTF